MAAFLEEYTLLDELGQGGYATVYKVRHNSLGYIRAIRVLNATIAHGESDKTYQKFLEECRLLLRLGNGNHPNIVHIYQPLLRAQKAIVEMDFVDGKDLFHYLEDKSSFVEVGDVMKLLTDIGSALAYCHEDIYKFCMDKEEDDLKDDPNDGSKVLLDAETCRRLINKYRVIHNDIHSGNIIRREDGNFVLLDFGLAVEGDSVVRSSRRKNGAPEFKAPEKWDNEGLLTTGSDIYSFGIVLYEFLAGRVPFLFDKKNSNSVEAEYLLGKAHKESSPESICELRKMAFERSHPGKTYKKDYPDWLEDLIMKCLAKDPNARFKNGKELYSYVQEHLSIGSSSSASKLKEENEKLRNIIEVANVSLADISHELSLANKDRDSLEKENQKLKSQNHSWGNKTWRNATFIFVLISISLCVWVIVHNNQTVAIPVGDNDVYMSTDDIDLKNAQEIITERNKLKEEVNSLRNSSPQNSANQESISSLRNQIQEKETQINNLTSRIQSLTSEISGLKSTAQSMVSQSVLTERENTISQLQDQIRNLNNTITKKNEEIKALQNQLFN